MKAVPAGAWEHVAGSPFIITTLVKALEPRGGRGRLASHLLRLFSALNGLVLFGLELTVVCFSSPLPFSPWPERLLKEQ